MLHNIFIAEIFQLCKWNGRDYITSHSKSSISAYIYRMCLCRRSVCLINSICFDRYPRHPNLIVVKCQLTSLSVGVLKYNIMSNSIDWSTSMQLRFCSRDSSTFIIDPTYILVIHESKKYSMIQIQYEINRTALQMIPLRDGGIFPGLLSYPCKLSVALMPHR